MKVNAPPTHMSMSKSPPVAMKPCTHLADLVKVAAGRHQVQLVAVHDGQQLLAHVLGPAQAAVLHKVLKAPGLGEVAALPGLIHRQQRQVVALRLEELGLLLIRL